VLLFAHGVFHFTSILATTSYGDIKRYYEKYLDNTQ